MIRRLLATGVAVAAVAATVTAPTPTAVADDPPAPLASPLGIQAPKKVVGYSWRGRVWTSLGIRLVAGAEPFEIWSNRASYDEPITSVWRTSGGDVPLPEGSMTNFAGLKNFLTLTYTRVRDGMVVKRQKVRVCFNGDSQRIRPDAPAESPYPWGCPWNPYTLGSVMGIEAGYASPLFEEWGRPIRIGNGKYDVTAAISKQWVDFFGIEEGDARTTTRLVVKKESELRNQRTATSDTTPDAQPAAQPPKSEAAGEPVPASAPDLKSLPAFDIGLNRSGTQLRFAATVWNGGGGPLVVDGFRSGDGNHMDAYQYFYDEQGNETGYQPVGEFGWHGKNHQHWHFENFARYRLLKADQTQAVKSRKASFCLANTDMVDYTIPRADWKPGNTDLSSDCGGSEALSLRQVLSNGSGDTYHQYRAGQAFPIKDLPDGVYYIAVEANAEGVLVEQETTNNVSLRKVRISTNERTGKRFVRVPKIGIIDER